MEPTTLTAEQQYEAAELAEALNEKLRAAGASNAEQAFGIGCGLGILPAVAIVALLYVFKVVNLILAIILLGMALTALMGIATIIAFQARVNAARQMYRLEVEPEIARYTSKHQLSRQQFDTLVYPSLTEDAPLRKFLSPVLPQPDEQGEIPV